MLSRYTERFEKTTQSITTAELHANHQNYEGAHQFVKLSKRFVPQTQFGNLGNIILNKWRWPHQSIYYCISKYLGPSTTEALKGFLRFSGNYKRSFSHSVAACTLYSEVLALVPPQPLFSPIEKPKINVLRSKYKPFNFFT